MDLFGFESDAIFSECRSYRYLLWRKWDRTRPMIMFIGLNPSTANETQLDPTVRRVVTFANRWGFGGVYMANCFPYVSTDPNQLKDCSNLEQNDRLLIGTKALVKEVVFAWGTFPIVKEKGRDIALSKIFPDAIALEINKNGTPKHPLYVKKDVVPVRYLNSKIKAYDNSTGLF